MVTPQAVATLNDIGTEVGEMAQTDLFAPDKPAYSGLLIHSFAEPKQHVRYNRNKNDNKWNVRVFI